MLKVPVYLIHLKTILIIMGYIKKGFTENLTSLYIPKIKSDEI